MKDNVVASYLLNAIPLIEQYIDVSHDQRIPVNHYLKNHFKKHPKFGKRDRNHIAELVYSYFRIGHALPKDRIKERILAGSYLSCNDETGIKHFLLQKEFGTIDTSKSLEEKIKDAPKLFAGLDLSKFLPFDIEFSEGITKEAFMQSFFKPAAVFIRVIEKYKGLVLEELNQNEIVFEEIESVKNCIHIKSNFNLNNLKTFTKGYLEIQDISSQQCGNYLEPAAHEYWWDMCAASGGKSLLLLSKDNRIKLLCSDVRRSILENLKDRFQRNGFSNYTTQIIDATKPLDFKNKFDGIICDAPCSGSGTWHRNPEELFFATEQSIKTYSELQSEILKNAVKICNDKTKFVYITCSVFKMENEKQIEKYAEFFKTSTSLNNLDTGGDAMFVANRSHKE